MTKNFEIKNIGTEEIIDLFCIHCDLDVPVKHSDLLKEQKLAEFYGNDEPYREQKGCLICNNMSGWFLTENGESLIRQIIEDCYITYLSEEIFKNEFLKEKTDYIYSYGDRIYIYIKKGMVCSEFAIINPSRTITGIRGVRGNTSEYVDDLDDVIDYYTRLKKDVEIFQKEVNKIGKIKTFSEVITQEGIELESAIIKVNDPKLTEVVCNYLKN